MKTAIVKTLLLSLFAAATFAAQAASPAAPDAKASDPVLKGEQVTESYLIDALNIAPPVAASGATRGFRAKTGIAQTDNASAQKAGPGKASLLITFNTNSTELTGEAKGLLDTLGRALQSDNLAGFGFRVEGHADPRGDADANQRLSQGRAQSVVDYLVSKGILAERLTAVGKGSSEPMNKARADAPENRRVTIVTTR